RNPRRAHAQRRDRALTRCLTIGVGRGYGCEAGRGLPVMVFTLNTGTRSPESGDRWAVRAARPRTNSECPALEPSGWDSHGREPREGAVDSRGWEPTKERRIPEGASVTATALRRPSRKRGSYCSARRSPPLLRRLPVSTSTLPSPA